VQDLQTAWFSILSPGYHIPAHRGVSKGIVRAHLGLLIPKEAEKCRMRVGDTINVWRPGEIFVFDDTYEHEVWNDTDEERVILSLISTGHALLGPLVTWHSLRKKNLADFYEEPKKISGLRAASRPPPAQRETRKPPTTRHVIFICSDDRCSSPSRGEEGGQRKCWEGERQVPG
jgi:beta-hydroxylase